MWASMRSGWAFLGGRCAEMSGRDTFQVLDHEVAGVAGDA